MDTNSCKDARSRSVRYAKVCHVHFLRSSWAPARRRSQRRMRIRHSSRESKGLEVRSEEEAPLRSVDGVPRQLCTGAYRGCMRWILDPLRTQGFALIRLTPADFAHVRALFTSCRTFFGRNNRHKEEFKVFPSPGGYLTPYPGSYELFEFRRDMSRYPDELKSKGMAVFELFEHISLRVCEEIGHDVGVNFKDMASRSSPAMRCIHYDRPAESCGDADKFSSPTVEDVPVGSLVRIVGLCGSDAALNGAKAVVESWELGEAHVLVSGSTEVFEKAKILARRKKFPVRNLRLLYRNYPGMYPAHTDSSLLTIAPRSTVEGLEVKDLKTGEWLTIEDRMSEDECIVFVGDPLDYATAHKYKALMHRPAVLNSAAGKAAAAGECRISIPFFLYPRKDVVLRCGDSQGLTFENLNANVDGCRDSFPWKLASCYYSDLEYS